MTEIDQDVLERWRRKIVLDRDFNLLRGPAAITYAEHHGLRVNTACITESTAQEITPAEARQHVARTGDPSAIWLRVVLVDAELRALCSEADGRGDRMQQFLARLALSGNIEAYQMCIAIIVDRWRREWIRAPGASRTKDLL